MLANAATPAIPTRRRWFAFSLRSLFVLMLLAGVLAAVLVRSWQTTQLRREYLNHAGAVNGHLRTMQGYSSRVTRRTLGGLLFNDGRRTEIWLYPGSYDEAYLKRLRELFPEADIKDYKSE
jgi:hypothetical protein